MEIDMGTSVSIMSEDAHERLWPTKEFDALYVKLQT